MKIKNNKSMKFPASIKVLSIISLLFVVFCCSSDDSSGTAPTPLLTLTGVITDFGEIDVLSFSSSQSVQVRGSHLTTNLNIETSSNFQVSLDDLTFSSSVSITNTDANTQDIMVYVRFTPAETEFGTQQGDITFKSDGAASIALTLNGIGVSITPLINLSVADLDFGAVPNATVSSSQSITVNGDNLSDNISITVTGDFEISLDDVTFTNTLQIDAANANEDNLVYARFMSSEEGSVIETLTFQSTGTDNAEVILKASGMPVTHNYVTFDSEHLAFGTGFNQSAIQTFTLHNDLSNIETINMYVQLRCPTGGCDELDVYANVLVRETDSNDWYEMGRYITPYWNDNSQLERGFMFDVTDFKSLLSGNTELKIFAESLNAMGYEVTVDFDYIEGTPDFPYYAIAEVMQYNASSLEGVPYGVSHNFDLDKTVSIPASSESTYLRTIISGSGEATPNDADGRGCAEWCYRTHIVIINNTDMFQHEMGPLGCASNPVSNQDPGNWQEDRAGWCPGMEVPIRIDEFASSMSGSSFTFKYDYEDWTSNGGNGDAFYATSIFVVVKSDTPIDKPDVI